MIIQCEKCKTRFRLDDSKVTEAGVRVRCSKCSHTFVVRKEEPEEETDFDLILQKFDQPQNNGASSEDSPRTGEDAPVSSFSRDVEFPASHEKVDDRPAEETTLTAFKVSVPDGEPAVSPDPVSMGADSAEKKEACRAEENFVSIGTGETPVSTDSATHMGAGSDDTVFSWDMESSSEDTVMEGVRAEGSPIPAFDAEKPDEAPAFSDSAFKLGDDFAEKTFSWDGEPSVVAVDQEETLAEGAFADFSPTPDDDRMLSTSDSAAHTGDKLPGTDFTLDEESAKSEDANETPDADEHSGDEPEVAGHEEKPAQTTAGSSGFFQHGVGLPQFQVDRDTREKVDGSESKTGMEQAYSSWTTADYSTQGASVLGDEASGAPSEKEAVGLLQDNMKRDEVAPQKSEGIEQSEVVPGTGIRDEIAQVCGLRERSAMDGELPPLSIASRRKESSLRPVFLGVVLVLLAIGAVIYLVKFKPDWLSGVLPTQISQKLGMGKTAGPGASIRTMEGHFVTNKGVGELLVIQGEAVNTSGKPLSALKVRGMIYGSDGAVLAERTVFCGSALTRDELENLPYSSLEKAMNKQFGDNLANLEVASGKAVPFVLVFRDVPKGARDFGVVTVSMTGSAQK
jgi:predicted Zn finger-like uncharacterized protein